MKYLLLATTALGLFAPCLAHAQTGQAAAPTPAAAPAEQEATGLDDIVVTAQRREENLQRAAVAVAAVAGDDLVSKGITQIDRLAELVPALNIQPSSNGNLLFIRGVGNFTLTPNADPASAFNYDGVYIGRPTSTTGVFFDLQRVEVLKGPQGTLYGRNATGGAVNVLPNQPRLGEFSGYGSLSYGSYDQLVAEGAINLPMGDRAAARLSFNSASHDGYFEDGSSDQDQWSVRLQAKAEITSDLTARVAADYSHSGGVGQSITYLGNYAYNPVAGQFAFRPSNIALDQGVYTPASQAYRRTIVAGPAGRTYDALSPYPFVDNSFSGVNAQIDWTTPVGTLTLIPAYRSSDIDYLASAGAFPYRVREKDEQTSLEARLDGNRIGILDYTLGVFVYNEKVDVKTSLTLGAAATFQDHHYRTDSLAPFARATLHLSDRLRVVGGIRYTDDDKTFRGPTNSLTLVCLVRIAGVPTCPSAPLIPLVDDISQLGSVPAPGGPPSPVLVNGLPTGAVLVRADRNDDAALTNKKTTYRGAVEFDLAPQSLLYASLETGFRSGGFNPATGFETFNPEQITAYTIGSKNRFWDNRVQLNAEVFWWDYSDQQVSSVQLDLAGRTVSITQNIGSSRIRGVELEGRFMVTSDTMVSTDIQYLDTENRSFNYPAANSGTPPITGCPFSLVAATNTYSVNCTGYPAFNSPEWTLNFAGEHTIHLDQFDLTLNANSQYKSGYYAGFGYLAESYIHPDWLTNAEASVGPADGRWSLSAYVRNIEDRRTPTFLALGPISNALIANAIAPRTYGLRLGVNF